MTTTKEKVIIAQVIKIHGFVVMSEKKGASVNTHAEDDEKRGDEARRENSKST